MTDATSTPRVFYRYDDPIGEGYTPHLREVAVLKATRAGHWVDDWGERRFVLSDAHKKFACPTEAEARVSYARRKARQVKILSARLKAAERDLAWARSGEPAKPPFFTARGLFHDTDGELA